MATTSRELREPTPRASATSHVIDAATLARYEPLARRIIGMLLWVFSFIGSVLAIEGWDGNWATFDWNGLPQTIMWTLVVQGACTSVQLVSCYRWFSPLYLIAVGVSSGLSIWGYRHLILAPLASAADSAATALWGVLAGDIAGAAALISAIIAIIAADIVPERIFVRH